MTDGTRVGLVADLWRFPVKSFAGERTRRMFVGPFGPLGDRRYAAVSDQGEPMSARRQTRLLGYRARYADAEGVEEARVETPDGRILDVSDPELEIEISSLLGRDISLQRSIYGFPDAAHMHLTTLDSVAALGTAVGDELDPRRFRANVLVELVDPAPFAEAAWPGHRLLLGETVELDVVVATERCAVTTVDPDTGERDKRVLAAIARTRENLFGVYGQVLRTGWVEVGDPVRLRARTP